MRDLDDVPKPARQAALAMRSELLARFSDEIAAIWLYGANVFGDTGVDVDLHVLLRDQPDEEQVGWLRSLDGRIAVEAGVEEIDCWYITLEAAHRTEPPRDLRHADFQDQHWPLHRAHWLAGACVVVHGLTPGEVVTPPTWSELEPTLRQELLDAAAHLGDGNAYWTLQLCRVLASLQTRDVVRSKLDSADWAIQRLPTHLHPAIEAAARFYRHATRPGDPELIHTGYAPLCIKVRSLVNAP